MDTLSLIPADGFIGPFFRLLLFLAVCIIAYAVLRGPCSGFIIAASRFVRQLLPSRASGWSCATNACIMTGMFIIIRLLSITSHFAWKAGARGVQGKP